VYQQTINPRPPVAANLEELRARFSREEIIALVCEYHPKGASYGYSPYAFFVLTHEEMNGPCTCTLTYRRVFEEYLMFCGGIIPLYFARCLLPDYRGSA
jgi:hypothetical protein